MGTNGCPHFCEIISERIENLGSWYDERALIFIWGTRVSASDGKGWRVGVMPPSLTLAIIPSSDPGLSMLDHPDPYPEPVLFIRVALHITPSTCSNMPSLKEELPLINALH